MTNEIEENQFPHTEIKPGEMVPFWDDEPVQPEVATIERLSLLVNRHAELNKQIADDTSALAEKTGEVDKIERDLIPGIMLALQMSEFKMEDGSKVSVKKDVKCNISVERKIAAFAWLREHNYDGIIKMKVVSEFGKGESDAAQKAVELMASNGYSVTSDEAVHPATLKSFVKECLENGIKIPTDAFGIFEYNKTSIVAPKKKK